MPPAAESRDVVDVAIDPRSGGNDAIYTYAAHPNAARLGVSFMVSLEGQVFLTRFGRLPTRDDVPTNPPGILDGVRKAKIVPVLLDGAEGRKWSKLFEEQFRRR